MIAGRITPSSMQHALLYNANTWQSLMDAANPFRLLTPSSTPATPATSSQQSKGVLSQLDQAIQPTKDASQMDIGMQDAPPAIDGKASTANDQQTINNRQQQDDASRKQAEASQQQNNANTQTNQANQALQSAQSVGNASSLDAATPGKALIDAARQAQQEVSSVSSDATQAGDGELGKLSLASSSLGQTSQLAMQSDKNFRDSISQKIGGLIKNIMGTGLSNAGQGLQGLGGKLDEAGTTLISVGQVLAAIPFTMPIGLLLIKIGTGLRAVGKALTTTGTGMLKNGTVMQQDAKQMGQDSSKLMLRSTQQADRGYERIQSTQTMVQTVRKTSSKKLAHKPQADQPNAANSAQAPAPTPTIFRPTAFFNSDALQTNQLFQPNDRLFNKA